jgi:GTP cyclohydrolase I
MRGVKQLHSRTVTSAVRGIFKTNPTTRSEFMSLLSLPEVRHDD